MSKATVSVNGREMGDVDELMANPTQEFKRAMRELVTRAMGVPVADVAPAPQEAGSTDLTTTDRANLFRYEAVIQRGLDTFVEVGNALAAIRNDKLYRGTHGTFADYCRERWDLGKSQVYRLISAAEVAGNLSDLSPMGDISERTIRPLAKLAPGDQRVAYATAVEDAGGKQPTPAHVERAVARVRPSKPATKPELAKPVYVEPNHPHARKCVGFGEFEGKCESVNAEGHFWCERCNTLRMAHLDSQMTEIAKHFGIDRDEIRQSVQDELAPDPAPTILERMAAAEAAIPTPDAPDADELAAMAEVAAELAAEDAERAERDGQRATYERVVEAVAVPAPTPEPPPLAVRPDDTRVDELGEGIEILTLARRWVQDYYGNLTGRHTDTLEFGRGVAKLLAGLRNELDALGGGA